MPKVTIQVAQDYTANLPKNSKIIYKDDQYVYWYRRNGENVDISYCLLDEFECQNDTQIMCLPLEMVKTLFADLKLK